MTPDGLCKTGLTTVLIRVTREEEAANITRQSSSIFTLSTLRPPYTKGYSNTDSQRGAQTKHNVIMLIINALTRWEELLGGKNMKVKVRGHITLTRYKKKKV